MKRKKQLTALVLLLPLLLTACDNFERNAYRTLNLAKVEYEILQDHAARAYVRGRLSPEQWDRFATTGNRFIAAHTLAADLAESYSRIKRAGDEDQRQALEKRIQQALARLPVLLGDLHQLLLSFDVKMEAETLAPIPTPSTTKEKP
jgi:hypothetical protein